MTKLIYHRSAVKKTLIDTWRSYTKFHEFAEFKIWHASIVGVFSFPLFYLIWTAIVPQPFESIRLRLIGSALCATLALSEYWPVSLRKHKAVLSYITFVYCLPFFFSYMMLMNNASTVWLLSMLAALMYLVFLIDAVNVVPATIIGTTLGTIAYLNSSTAPVFAPPLYTAIPILLFTFIGMLFLSFGTNQIVDEKLKAASTLAGYIAHEMRTPLASIRLNAQTVEDMVAVLSDAYVFARSHGFEGPHIRPEKIEMLRESCDSIVAQSNSANAVIDALLINLSETSRQGRAPGTWSVNSMRETLHHVLDDRAMKNDAKIPITVLGQADFNFLGSRDLISHVMYNLIRNALRAAAETSGSVTVELVVGQRWNSVIVADDGPGIDPRTVSHLFTPFKSFNRDSGGSGLGLAFCRLVVENIGGTINCESTLGQGATFTVQLPALGTTIVPDRETSPAGLPTSGTMG
jgi:two-component system, CAI-1 autoinducer sensor kinase/phosphatase CqsS